MASHLTDYKQPMLFLNTVAVLVLVVAKLPNMHKVRIFGINADIWGSRMEVYGCLLQTSATAMQQATVHGMEVPAVIFV
jgi:hypothetical protein